MSPVSLSVYFFFKQKTAYEMRISDWSSDVCSSDLEGAQAVIRRQSEIVRKSVEDASKVLSELNAAETPQDRLLKQAELAKEAYEAAVANLQELTEIARKSNGEAAGLLSARVSGRFGDVTGENQKTATNGRGTGRERVGQ